MSNSHASCRVVRCTEAAVNNHDPRRKPMPKPQISFQNGVDLPFMIDLYPEDDDGDSDPDHNKILKRMKAAIPKHAIKLGTVEQDLDHSPGLTWRIEEHYYLLPLKDQPHDSVLLRIHWDDDRSRYDWSQDAVGSGFEDGKAAGRAMAAAFFEACNIDMADEGYAHYREFLKRL